MGLKNWWEVLISFAIVYEVVVCIRQPFSMIKTGGSIEKAGIIGSGRRYGLFYGSC